MSSALENISAIIFWKLHWKWKYFFFPWEWLSVRSPTAQSQYSAPAFQQLTLYYFLTYLQFFWKIASAVFLSSIIYFIKNFIDETIHKFIKLLSFFKIFTSWYFQIISRPCKCNHFFSVLQQIGSACADGKVSMCTAWISTCWW